MGKWNCLLVLTMKDEFTPELFTKAFPKSLDVRNFGLVIPWSRKRQRRWALAQYLLSPQQICCKYLLNK